MLGSQRVVCGSLYWWTVTPPRSLGTRHITPSGGRIRCSPAPRAGEGIPTDASMRGNLFAHVGENHAPTASVRSFSASPPLAGDVGVPPDAREHRERLRGLLLLRRAHRGVSPEAPGPRALAGAGQGRWAVLGRPSQPHDAGQTVRYDSHASDARWLRGGDRG